MSSVGGFLTPICAGLALFCSLVAAIAPARSMTLEELQEVHLGQVHQAQEIQDFWTSANREVLSRAIAQRPDHGLPPEPSCASDLRDPIQATLCLIRHVHALRFGSASTVIAETDGRLPPPPPPKMEALIDSLRGERLSEYLDSLAPPTSAYRDLMAALQHYRGISEQDWAPLPDTEEILPVEHVALFEEVGRRLRIEGDLADPATDAGEIAAAVRRFQARNGLVPDGRIGKQTIASLNEGPRRRAARIAVALERWRQGPHEFPSERIEVNVADESVRFYWEGRVVLELRAIVGALKHPTPVLAASITAVTFNPSWTIPNSIASKEILPKLRRNAGYLAAHEIEILRRDDDPYGLNVDWHRVRAERFPFQLRQKPGAKNPLGAVKFEMANTDAVYLHDTPDKTLFLRPQRTFSHGCIRVERAAELAAEVLAALGAAAADHDITSAETYTAPLDRPLPIFVLYRTAFVDERGQLQFRPDVYQRDPVIAGALGLDLVKPAPTPAGKDVSCAPTAPLASAVPG